MSININLSLEDEALFTSYAIAKKLSLSDFFVKAAMDMLETERDIEIYRQAMEEYEKDPMTYTHEETRELLGIKA